MQECDIRRKESGMKNWKNSSSLVAALLFCVLVLADKSLAAKIGPVHFDGAIESP